MPWKLILFLTGLVLMTFFIGFNLDNRCDVSLIFYTFHNVPIYVGLLFAYACGAITLIPFIIVAGTKAAKKATLSKIEKPL